MDMLTAVTADVMNNLSPDAGIVMYDIVLEDVTDAKTMVQLIEEMRGDAAHWIGVTDGGIKVNEGRTAWSPNWDGKRMDFVGDKFLDKAEPKISFTMLEFIPENVVLASGAADKDGTDTHVTVTPRASYKAEDYKRNVVFVTMVGAEGIYAAELQNALCTKGLDASTADKAVAKLAVEFTGHKSDPTELDTLPIKYHFFPAANAVAAAAKAEGGDEPAAYDPETAAAE